MDLYPTLPAEFIAIRKLPNSMKRVDSNGDYVLFPSSLRIDLNSYDGEQVREQTASRSYGHEQFGRRELYTLLQFIQNSFN